MRKRPLTKQSRLRYKSNGKLRGTISLPKDITREDAFAAAKKDTNVAAHLADKQIVKEIFVPGKIVNFVVK